MTYYADLTPYSYTKPGPLLGVPLLNVGWLGEGRPYTRGPTPPEFRQKLLAFCRNEHVVYLARGFHVCELCDPSDDATLDPLPQLGEAWTFTGNGQIRVLGDGVIYAAPTLISHYVIDHEYLPPAAFVAAIMAGDPDSEAHRALRTALQGSHTSVLYQIMQQSPPTS